MLIRCHMVDEHPHRHRRRVPATRADASEIGPCRGLVAEMEGLRIVFRSELDDLLARDAVASEGGRLTDLHVLKILHACLLEPARRGGNHVEMVAAGAETSARSIPPGRIISVGGLYG